MQPMFNLQILNYYNITTIIDVQQTINDKYIEISV